MKRIISIFLLFFICTFPGHSQKMLETAALTSVLLEEREDSLHIELDIAVHSGTLQKDRSLTLVPELAVKDNSSSYTFPRILINGKRKGQLYRRRLGFKEKAIVNDPPYMRIDIKSKMDTTLLYRYAVPYQYWMDTASLRIHQVYTACADKEQTYTIENRARVKVQPYNPYQPTVFINYIEPQLEVKNRDMKGEAYLDFEVGKYAILPNFRRNPEELEKITSTIRKVAYDPDVKIEGIEITGCASPEGSFDSNLKLSTNRATALTSYIRERFEVAANLYKVESAGEDWDGLRNLVEAASFADRDKVLAIIDSDDAPDRKEQKLKALGATYRMLLNDYFPQLRRVKYSINYIVRDYSVEETSELVKKNPEHLSPYELYQITILHPRDSEEWNELVELAARIHPEHPEANINAAAAMLTQKELEKARIYLERVGNDPRANNNWSAYYLLKGDPDKAEEYTRKVDSGNQENAFHNRIEAERLREDQERWRKRGYPIQQ